MDDDDAGGAGTAGGDLAESLRPLLALRSGRDHWRRVVDPARADDRKSFQGRRGCRSLRVAGIHRSDDSECTVGAARQFDCRTLGAVFVETETRALAQRVGDRPAGCVSRR